MSIPLEEASSAYENQEVMNSKGQCSLDQSEVLTSEAIPFEAR